jgi:hypothetical protein
VEFDGETLCLRVSGRNENEVRWLPYVSIFFQKGKIIVRTCGSSEGTPAAPARDGECAAGIPVRRSAGGCEAGMKLNDKGGAMKDPALFVRKAVEWDDQSILLP